VWQVEVLSLPRRRTRRLRDLIQQCGINDLHFGTSGGSGPFCHDVHCPFINPIFASMGG